MTHDTARAHHVLPNLDWQLSAACRGMDTDVFYSRPGERTGRKLRGEARAKSVCLRCPVRNPCLDWALRVGEPYGVWGGLTADERRRLRAAEN
jgi:WhiB family redox-sensing transcriptional regulator